MWDGRTLRTVMRRARGGGWSAIVRLGLGWRGVGRLVAEEAALLLLYLRRVGSDSLEANAGRGILVDVVGTAGRARGASEPWAVGRNCRAACQERSLSLALEWQCVYLSSCSCSYRLAGALRGGMF